MKYTYPLLIALAIWSCQPKTNQEEHKQEQVSEQQPVYQTPDHHSPSLTKVFDAHGGYEKWSKMKSLAYTKGEEGTITNLHNRKIRLESPQQIIGFDGEQVWVLPDTVDASRARFYHNLYFYFYAMPFVVGDPGAYYESVDPMDLGGNIYEGIKVSYGSGVGDAPDDNYILWYDPETFQMEWLMYTVTYSSGEPNEEYRLIKYGDWQSVEGLMLPGSMQWYQYDGAQVGEPRGEATLFTDVALTLNYPEESIFTVPEGAQIAPR